MVEEFIPVATNTASMMVEWRRSFFLVDFIITKTAWRPNMTGINESPNRTCKGDDSSPSTPPRKALIRSEEAVGAFAPRFAYCQLQFMIIAPFAVLRSMRECFFCRHIYPTIDGHPDPGNVTIKSRHSGGWSRRWYKIEPPGCRLWSLDRECVTCVGVCVILCTMGFISVDAGTLDIFLFLM